MSNIAQNEANNHESKAAASRIAAQQQGEDPEVGDPGYIKRAELSEAWLNWAVSVRDWKNFLTLTFRDEVTQEKALKVWRRLVRILNEEAFGKHYTRLVKHSYFSYILGIEPQARGVIHFHVLVDRPVNFSLIHRCWIFMVGYAWIKPVSDRRGAVEYVSKYTMKGGEVLAYLADPSVLEMKPFHQFLWWRE